MNNEIYLEFTRIRKKEEQESKDIENLISIIDFKNYFKTEESKKAIQEIQGYLRKAQQRDYNHLYEIRNKLLNTCDHEIIIKTQETLMCAICGKRINALEEHPNIMIEIEDYMELEDILKIAEETIEEIANKNLILIETFETIFREKIEVHNQTKKHSYKIRRNKWQKMKY